MLTSAAMQRAALPQRASLPRSRACSSRALAVRCSSAAAAGGRQPAVPSAPLLRLTAAAAGLVQRCVAGVRAAAAAQVAHVAALDAEELNVQIRGSLKQMRVLALVAPFAAVSGGADTFMIITKAVASFIKLYLLLLFVRVLLSWFPTFKWWEQQPFSALRQVRLAGPVGGAEFWVPPPPAGVSTAAGLPLRMPGLGRQQRRHALPV